MDELFELKNELFQLRKEYDGNINSPKSLYYPIITTENILSDELPLESYRGVSLNKLFKIIEPYSNKDYQISIKIDSDCENYDIQIISIIEESDEDYKKRLIDEIARVKVLISEKKEKELELDKKRYQEFCKKYGGSDNLKEFLG